MVISRSELATDGFMFVRDWHKADLNYVKVVCLAVLRFLEMEGVFKECEKWMKQGYRILVHLVTSSVHLTAVRLYIIIVIFE